MHMQDVQYINYFSHYCSDGEQQNLILGNIVLFQALH